MHEKNIILTALHDQLKEVTVGLNYCFPAIVFNTNTVVPKMLMVKITVN